ncbi:MAG: fatty acid desaturase [Pedobacter sp.]|nr:fatty acid desaturase [Pedobacter sp.]
MNAASNAAPSTSRLASELRINAEDAARSQRIRQGILEAGNALRARHPWLEKHQNAIGMTIFWASIAGILGTAWAYYAGAIAWYVAIPLAAFCMSILHELEHDLIHMMYFRKNKFWNDFMLAGVWLFRPSTISPWVRRRLHIHHHKVSGTETDLEERGITNGEKWGVKRLLMTGDNMLAIYLRPFATYKMTRAFVREVSKTKEEAHSIARENVLGYFPLGVINYALWHGFIVYHATLITLGLFGIHPAIPAVLESVMSVVNFYAVVIAAPNALRTFCLHFVSSNMHYYGDVEKGNIVQQCQIWTTPWAIPLHLFCFNFAGTHAFHHFVVRDAFYIRQWLAPGLYPLMRENGVRFNDFGTFKRANRMHAKPVLRAVPAVQKAAA